MLKMIEAGKDLPMSRERDQKDSNRLEMSKRGKVTAE